MKHLNIYVLKVAPHRTVDWTWGKLTRTVLLSFFFTFGVVELIKVKMKTRPGCNNTASFAVFIV